MGNKVVAISEEVYEATQSEIENLNQQAEREYRDQYRLAEENQRRKLTQPQRLTMKNYTESALGYLRANHIDPRTMGQEYDVLTEVRKLRNNVFSFMQVQERTYLMPFVEDVFKLKNQVDAIETVNYDMLNLMEVFIDMLLAGLGLSDLEQDAMRAKAAENFQRKRASRNHEKG